MRGERTRMEPLILIGEANSDSLRIVEALGNCNARGIYLCSNVEAFSEALQDARNNGSERVTIVGASIASSARIEAIVQGLAQAGSGLNVFSSSIDTSRFDLTDLSVENLIPLVRESNINLADAVSAPLSLFTAIPEQACDRIGILALYLAVEALIGGEEIAAVTTESELQGAHASLDAAEAAELLRFVVSECNIEELFPNHAWKEHEEESLSFCYHTLAAIFIRLGDSAGAIECLNISEQFEDSPRLLALRGIIASHEGRTLEAVANMVSSLQQYEVRKKNNGEHYMTFTPTDLEDINVDLKDGLDALNRRDNAMAFECFSKAIFNFDSFYRELGIEAMAKAI